MAAFQGKIRGKTLRKIENKNFLSVSFLPDAKIENSKKIAKNFKKLNNTIMASFQAKVGWKMMRKRENKNCHSVSFLPVAQLKIPTK